MKSAIWISFDLGVRGDYEGMYAWLDRHGAKECGSGIAILSYEYTGDFLEALKPDLAASIQTDKKTRIYVIYRESSTGQNKGQFIFGGRKASPWEGYATETTPADIGEPYA